MTNQPEALRLADRLGMLSSVFVTYGPERGERLCANAAIELRRQHAEIEQLRAEREEDQGVIAVWRGRTLQAEAEIEQLRADAERYRWLRENALAMDTVADPDNFVQIWVGTDPASCFKARTLDAAIDAARAEERKP